MERKSRKDRGYAAGEAGELPHKTLSPFINYQLGPLSGCFSTPGAHLPHNCVSRRGAAPLAWDLFTPANDAPTSNLCAFAAASLAYWFIVFGKIGS